MYIFIYIHIYINIYIYTYLYTFIYIHIYTCIYIYAYIYIGLTVRLFTNGLYNRGSIPCRLKKWYLMPIIQHCKVWIKGKVVQSREKSSALPDTSVQ